MHLWHNNVIERGKFLIRQLEMDRARGDVRGAAP